MFYLSKIEHTLRLPPHLLRLPLNEAIKLELENVFLDKVIANLGLCISIYDIKEIEGGFVYPGEGASTHTVKFRLVVFRPFVGEIIAAKLKESDANGLRLSLGFFEDIYVPSHLLPSPSRSEPDPYGRYEVKWIWEFGDTKYVIDGLDEIKFRVLSVNYPSIPIEQAEGSKPFAPMVINFKSGELLICSWEYPHLLGMGSIDYDGLGPVSWWRLPIADPLSSHFHSLPKTLTPLFYCSVNCVMCILIALMKIVEIEDPHIVDVDGKFYSARHILIPVGGRPFIRDISGSEDAIDSDAALDLPSKPEKIAICWWWIHCLGISWHLQWSSKRGLEKVGVKMTKNGAIEVDEYSGTAVPYTRAVGDVADKINLTPVALMEGGALAKAFFLAEPTNTSV
ncbi:hypothetical protein WN944_016768 [Citrus x changshan-huyou]|uniref:DNA-directed RNA polymerase subunit n=2 Tax=Citrus TaxID=2706 RepID=A0AAP0M9Y4_9ROSI